MKTDPQSIDRARRTFLSQSFAGIGAFALASLMDAPAQGGVRTTNEHPWKALPGLPHFPPKAKRIVHLCMAGGPSHLESFDPKPELVRINGQPFPDSFTQGEQLAQLQNAKLNALGSFSKFRKWGKSGLEISESFPHLGSIADELCVIRSMTTEQINHDTAHAFMNTGSIIKGRPCMGSWVLYGLGAETDNLPGYIVMTSQGPGAQPVSARQWSAGVLPSKFQGVAFQGRGLPVHYIGNPAGVCQSTQRQVVDEIQRLNGMLTQRHIDPEIETRIAQYEMAFQMQTATPDLINMADESQETLDLYGIKTPGDGSFASNCLMARRLLERGVRFVQLYHRGWDHHRNLKKDFAKSAMDCDQPSAALVKDLKKRGLLEDTLVLWGGEFGRTPMAQGGDGRDHHINAFSVWMAGGGIKPGMAYGATDELGYRSVEDVVTVHDLHATLLHLFGVNHEKFTTKFQGLDLKLTGVEPAHVVEKILA
ncbi:MAG: DUF1501 domain-containing protein [Planctomycetaceae bacterium]|nr:DUF1501 domain-containing protein [Planctomycetaceae bacterium]MCP4463506.1 DUF1501 domain-containing protein [Planctomycetaceae bacterium]MDG1807813.1 DUF1501 domain-containing protein [Pirellulaceae bacterium]MDG2102490.1 DUF1501 domain-containing protein [Pirellulaceae bacterium]